MKASDARPITICSIWYRIWAPTLCNDASSVWSTSTGTCAHALRSWMKSKDFPDVRPSVLFHACTNVYADVSCQPSPVTVGSLIGLAAHNCVRGGGPGCSRHGLSLVVTSSSISSFRGYSHLADVGCPCCYSCLRCYFQHCAAVVPSSDQPSACHRGCRAVVAGLISARPLCLRCQIPSCSRACVVDQVPKLALADEGF